MQEARIPLEAGASNQNPSRIIVHAMGEFIDTDPQDYHAVDWLQKLGLSAHAFITPSGVVIRGRDDAQGAFHAKGNNTDTLGIEFLVPGLHTYTTFLEAMKKKYLTKDQYQAGVELVRHWQQTYNIDQIKRHSDISPGRKSDPGKGFPWDQFIADVNIGQT